MNTSKTRNRINFQSKDECQLSQLFCYSSSTIIQCSNWTRYTAPQASAVTSECMCMCQLWWGYVSDKTEEEAWWPHLVCMYVCMWYTHVTYAQTPSSLGMLPRCPQMVLQKEPKTFDFLCKSNQVGILGAYSFSSGLQEHVYRSLFFMTGIRGLPLVFCAKVFYQTATKNKVWHTNLS